MKKFAKLSAVLAAMVLALSFVGCSDDDDDDDDGLQAVTEVDTSKLATGTYKYTMTNTAYSQGQSMNGTETGQVAMINSADTVSMTTQSFIIRCSDSDVYNSVKDEYEEEADKYTFNENALTISLKAAKEPEFFSFSDFKEDYLTFPEDDDFSEGGNSYKSTYTDKSLRMAEDGSKVVCSYRCNFSSTYNGTTTSGTASYAFVLERLK